MPDYLVLRCPKCSHTWPYRGTAARRCNCPACGAYITLRTNVIPVLWEYTMASLRNKASWGKAYLDLQVFNKKTTIGINIISDDGKYVRTIHMEPKSLGVPAKMIQRALKGVKDSGRYPLDKEMLDFLKEVVKSEIIGDEAQAAAKSSG